MLSTIEAGGAPALADAIAECLRTHAEKFAPGAIDMRRGAPTTWASESEPRGASLVLQELATTLNQ